MTDLRNRLPNRRQHWLYRFECDGQAIPVASAASMMAGSQVFINRRQGWDRCRDQRTGRGNRRLARPATRMPRRYHPARVLPRPGERGRWSPCSTKLPSA